ncbi:hypothetical protein [Evansella cellulosilytica]|uniref:Ubiquitin-like protein n=1 Tax=Evansella cellulosilytica (strain ATCC 21833 / DSM 2522 / FERM P-1141 / JCM 9156 / N-4) TaxID=649639 RepID=E6U270_EVAC2|nr:hypothetical protein [Evansella cellulosilytica]ADU30448.1 ubiquitin-like protein [Evansella cellulosilytica DSM 2522]
MPYRDKQQYKVTSGSSKESGRNATYEYTSGNKQNKDTHKKK